MSLDTFVYALAIATLAVAAVVVVCALMVLRDRCELLLDRLSTSPRVRRSTALATVVDRLGGVEEPRGAPAVTRSPIAAASTVPTSAAPGVRSVAAPDALALWVDPLPSWSPAGAPPLAPRILDTVLDTVAEEPVTARPVLEQPVLEQPVAEQPVAEQPVAEQPVAEAREPEAPSDLAELAAELQAHVVHLDAERERLLGNRKPARRRRRPFRHATVPARAPELQRELEADHDHPGDARDLVVTEREPTSEISVCVVTPDSHSHPVSQRRGA